MSNKALYAVVGLLLLAGTSLIGYSIYKINARANLVTEEGVVTAELNRVRDDDLRVLTELGSSDEQISRSLRRYTSQNLPESESLIKKFLASESVMVRAAAIESSGAYDWADIEVFADALRDRAEALRLAALRGLSKRSDADRIRLVNEHSARISKPNKEWLTAKLTLIKLVPDASVKARHLEEILERTGKMEKGLRDEAIKSLFRALPRNEQLMQVARREVKNMESSAGAQALQYLSANDKDWIRKEFAALPMKDEYIYQLVAIDVMVAHCPDGWQTIADRIKAGPAAQDVVTAIEDARLGIKCRLGL